MKRNKRNIEVDSSNKYLSTIVTLLPVVSDLPGISITRVCDKRTRKLMYTAIKWNNGLACINNANTECVLNDFETYPELAPISDITANSNILTIPGVLLFRLTKKIKLSGMRTVEDVLSLYEAIMICDNFSDGTELETANKMGYIARLMASPLFDETGREYIKRMLEERSRCLSQSLTCPDIPEGDYQHMTAQLSGVQARIEAMKNVKSRDPKRPYARDPGLDKFLRFLHE